MTPPKAKRKPPPPTNARGIAPMGTAGGGAAASTVGPAQNQRKVTKVPAWRLNRVTKEYCGARSSTVVGGTMANSRADERPLGVAAAVVAGDKPGLRHSAAAASRWDAWALLRDGNPLSTGPCLHQRQLEAQEWSAGLLTPLKGADIWVDRGAARWHCLFH